MNVIEYAPTFDPDDGDPDEVVTIVTNRAFTKAMLSVASEGFYFVDENGDKVVLTETESELIESGLYSISSALNA